MNTLAQFIITALLLAVGGAIIVTIIMLFKSSFRISSTLPEMIGNPSLHGKVIYPSLDSEGRYFKIPSLINSWVYECDYMWVLIIRLSVAEIILDATLKELKRERDG